MASRCWETTVNELVLIARESLLSLVPSMDRAHIHWRETEAYDDWDEISETIFRNIVVRSIEHAESSPHITKAARYGFVYGSYSEIDYVRSACSTPLPLKLAAFVGFATGERPFDLVRFIPLDEHTLRPVGIPQTAPWDTCRFSFMHRTTVGHIEELTTLNVSL